MAKYRKRPVVIDAFRLADANDPAGYPEWYKRAMDVGTVRHDYGHHDYGHHVIVTLEGEMSVSRGDWVIRGVEGELYPCRDSIFTATYEPAEG